MDNETALEILKVLVDKGGHLKIVTSERSNVPDEELAPRNGNPLADPRAWVIHDVVKLEGPDDRGRMVAYSAEGDATIGYPAALLKRLTEGAR